MAATAAAPDLRSGVAHLSGLAAANLRALWHRVSDAVQAREALREVLPHIVDQYGSAAATLAAEWYDDLRIREGVGGSFTAIPAQPATGGTDALASWGVSPLFSAEPDWNAALVLVTGGLQRRIANTARQTITVSSIADPAAEGWQRVTSPGACAFCVMLAGRGAIYSEATADFGAHDHCNCGAVPRFKGRPRLVRPVKDYTPSQKDRGLASDPNSTRAKDNARAREWMRGHGLL